MKHEFLECGKVINKRGIGGELKVECYCDSTKSVFGAKKIFTDPEGNNEYDVISLKDYNGFLYIKLSGICSAEDADAMRGKLLYVRREDIKIESGKNFVADLIGLKVIDADNGTEYGTVKDIQNFGASDIYVITNGKNTYYLPAVDGIIVSADIENCILVRPIPGIFDNAEEIR